MTDLARPYDISLPAISKHPGVTLPAAPHEVYETLMDPGRHSKLTGAKASISRRVGGRFSIYGGDLTGRNLELVPNRRIVQEWRFAMDGWPQDHYSRVIFSLTPLGGGTKLSFTQTGVPASCRREISGNWQEYYWKPMKQLLGE